MANAGIIQVVLTGDLAGLDNALRRAESRLESFGAATQRVGRQMSMRITAPLVLAGGAATRFATQFDSALTKIVTLVGINRDQVNAWREDILKLSVATGRGPGELAEAMFVVTSAGARGALALQVLDQSARAAALGLGDTATVARAVTAAVTAYGEENLSAARAVEILVATVRAGNLEASELAGVLGRVLSSAKQAGVTFEQVGAFLATFTRLGVNSAEAVTALRSVLNVIAKPTNDARKALQELGTSVEEVRRTVREDGLEVALIRLVKTFGDNEDAITRVIPNVRAFTGVLGVATEQADAYLEISDQVTNSNGILAEAFEKLAEDPAFAMAQFRAQIQTLAIAVGESLAKALRDAIIAARPMIETFIALAGAFNDTSQSTQRAVIGLVALVAIAGPAILLLNQMIFMVSGVVGAMRMLTTAVIALKGGAAMGGLAVLMSPTGLLVAGLTVVVGLLGVLAARAISASVATARATAEMRGQISALNREQVIIDAGQTMANLEAAEARLVELQGQVRHLDGMSGTITVNPAGLKEAQDAVDGLRRRFALLEERRRDIIAQDAEMERQLAAMRGELEAFGEGMGTAAAATDAVADAQERLATELRVIAGLSELLGEEFDEQQSTVNAYQGALEALLAAGLKPTNAALIEYAQIIKEGTESLRERAEAESDRRAAEQEAANLLRSIMTEEEAWAAQQERITALRKEGIITADEEAQLLERLNPLWREAQQVLADILEPAERYTATVERLNEMLAAGFINQEQFTAAVAMAGKRMRSELNEVEESLIKVQLTSMDVAQSIESALTAAALSGENRFRAMVNSMIRDLVRLAARVAALRLVSSLFPGGFAVNLAMGTAITGMAATGANVRPGERWVVGEGGRPEIFEPGVSGQVRPIMAAPAGAVLAEAIAGGGAGGQGGPVQVSGSVQFDVSNLPPPRVPATPEVAAVTDWYHRLFSAAYVRFRETGGQ